MARLQVFRGTVKVMEAPLLTAEDVARGTLTQRATDGALELGRSLIKNGFQRVTRKNEPSQ